jgi:hypothetical protein
VPEVVFLEAIDLAAGSVSHFSHLAGTIFSDIFLLFCRELEVTKHIKNSAWVLSISKNGSRYTAKNRPL